MGECIVFVLPSSMSLFTDLELVQPPFHINTTHVKSSRMLYYRHAFCLYPNAHPNTRYGVSVLSWTQPILDDSYKLYSSTTGTQVHVLDKQPSSVAKEDTRTYLSYVSKFFHALKYQLISTGKLSTYRRTRRAHCYIF